MEKTDSTNLSKAACEPTKNKMEEENTQDSEMEEDLLEKQIRMLSGEQSDENIEDALSGDKIDDVEVQKKLIFEKLAASMNIKPAVLKEEPNVNESPKELNKNTESKPEIKTTEPSKVLNKISTPTKVLNRAPQKVIVISPDRIAKLGLTSKIQSVIASQGKRIQAKEKTGNFTLMNMKNKMRQILNKSLADQGPNAKSTPRKIIVVQKKTDNMETTKDSSIIKSETVRKINEQLLKNLPKTETKSTEDEIKIKEDETSKSEDSTNPEPKIKLLQVSSFNYPMKTLNTQVSESLKKLKENNCTISLLVESDDDDSKNKAETITSEVKKTSPLALSQSDTNVRVYKKKFAVRLADSDKSTDDASKDLKVKRVAGSVITYKPSPHLRLEVMKPGIQNNLFRNNKMKIQLSENKNTEEAPEIKEEINEVGRSSSEMTPVRILNSELKMTMTHEPPTVEVKRKRGRPKKVKTNDMMEEELQLPKPAKSVFVPAEPSTKRKRNSVNYTLLNEGILDQYINEEEDYVPVGSRPKVEPKPSQPTTGKRRGRPRKSDQVAKENETTGDVIKDEVTIDNVKVEFEISGILKEEKVEDEVEEEEGEMEEEELEEEDDDDESDFSEEDMDYDDDSDESFDLASEYRSKPKRKKRAGPGRPGRPRKNPVVVNTNTDNSPKKRGRKPKFMPVIDDKLHLTKVVRTFERRKNLEKSDESISELESSNKAFIYGGISGYLESEDESDNDNTTLDNYNKDEEVILNNVETIRIITEVNSDTNNSEDNQEISEDPQPERVIIKHSFNVDNTDDLNKSREGLVKFKNESSKPNIRILNNILFHQPKPINKTNIKIDNIQVYKSSSNPISYNANQKVIDYIKQNSPKVIRMHNNLSSKETAIIRRQTIAPDNQLNKGRSLLKQDNKYTPTVLNISQNQNSGFKKDNLIKKGDGLGVNKDTSDNDRREVILITENPNNVLNSEQSEGLCQENEEILTEESFYCKQTGNTDSNSIDDELIKFGQKDNKNEDVLNESLDEVKNNDIKQSISIQENANDDMVRDETLNLITETQKNANNINYEPVQIVGNENVFYNVTSTPTTSQECTNLGDNLAQYIFCGDGNIILEKCENDKYIVRENHFENQEIQQGNFVYQIISQDNNLVSNLNTQNSGNLIQFIDPGNQGQIITTACNSGIVGNLVQSVVENTLVQPTQLHTNLPEVKLTHDNGGVIYNLAQVPTTQNQLLQSTMVNLPEAQIHYNQSNEDEDLSLALENKINESEQENQHSLTQNNENPVIFESDEKINIKNIQDNSNSFVSSESGKGETYLSHDELNMADSIEEENIDPNSVQGETSVYQIMSTESEVDLQVSDCEVKLTSSTNELTLSPNQSELKLASEVDMPQESGVSLSFEIDLPTESKVSFSSETEVEIPAEIDETEVQMSSEMEPSSQSKTEADSHEDAKSPDIEVQQQNELVSEVKFNYNSNEISMSPETSTPAENEENLIPEIDVRLQPDPEVNSVQETDENSSHQSQGDLLHETEDNLSHDTEILAPRTNDDELPIDETVSHQTHGHLLHETEDILSHDTEILEHRNNEDKLPTENEPSINQENKISNENLEITNEINEDESNSDSEKISEEKCHELISTENQERLEGFTKMDDLQSKTSEPVECNLVSERTENSDSQEMFNENLQQKEKGYVMLRNASSDGEINIVSSDDSVNGLSPQGDISEGTNIINFRTNVINPHAIEEENSSSTNDIENEYTEPSSSTIHTITETDLREHIMAPEKVLENCGESMISEVPDTCTQVEIPNPHQESTTESQVDTLETSNPKEDNLVEIVPQNSDSNLPIQDLIEHKLYRMHLEEGDGEDNVNKLSSNEDSNDLKIISSESSSLNPAIVSEELPQIHPTDLSSHPDKDSLNVLRLKEEEKAYHHRRRLSMEQSGPPKKRSRLRRSSSFNLDENPNEEMKNQASSSSQIKFETIYLEDRNGEESSIVPKKRGRKRTIHEQQEQHLEDATESSQGNELDLDIDPISADVISSNQNKTLRNGDVITQNPSKKKTEPKPRKKPSKSDYAGLQMQLIVDTVVNGIIERINKQAEETVVKTEVKDEKNVHTCAICKNTVTDWYYHKRRIHNDLAWRVGDAPLKFSRVQDVMYIFNNIYKQKKPLYCDTCKESKKSVNGFLAHLMQCGKSKDELEIMKIKCELCDHMILPFSLVVHMQQHRKKEEDANKPPKANECEFVDPSKKRKAAKRATTLIQNATADEDPKDSKEDARVMQKYYILDKLESKFIANYFRDELKNSGLIPCLYSSCTYVIDDVEHAIEHIKRCEFKPDKCYICKKCCKVYDNPTDIKTHIKSEHVHELFNPKNEEEVEVEEIEEHKITVSKSHGDKKPNPSVWNICKFQFLGAEKADLDISRQLCHKNYAATLQFCENNFSSTLYENHLPLEVNWNALDPKEISSYLPLLKESMFVSSQNVTSVKVNNNCNDLKKLKMFETAFTPKGDSIIFTGGSNVANAWVPTPYTREDCEQILAVSVVSDPDKVYSYRENYFDKGVIQFWNFGVLNNKVTSTYKPQLEFCLAHDCGAIFNLEWCPSGCYDSVRLGLLAITSTDGCAYIYSIIQPNKLKSKIVKTKPRFKLQIRRSGDFSLSGHEFYPSKISWSKSKGHECILVGYSNGVLALYDLNTTSNALKTEINETIILHPTYSIQAHLAAITGLAIIPSKDDNHCAVSAGNDRLIKYWNFDDFSRPTVTSRRAHAKDIVWMHNWYCTVAATDDCGNASNTILCYPQDFITSVQNQCLFSSTSVNAISGSDWGSFLIQGNQMGEIIGCHSKQVLPYISEHAFKRFYIAHSKLLDVKDREVLKTYKDFMNRKLVFGDFIMDSYFTLIKSSQILASSKGLYGTPDYCKYPIQSINSLAINPNRQSFLYFAAGFQSGFLKVFHLKMFA